MQARWNRRDLLAFAAGSLVFRRQLLAGGYAFWAHKDASQWSPEETRTFLSDSPWAVRTTATYIPDARPVRGWSERPPFPINAGARSPYTGTVRWESARPVREAVKDSLPTKFASHYAVLVSGFPTTGEVSEKYLALLQIPRTTTSVPADLIEKRPGNPASFLFRFPPIAAIHSAQEVSFCANLGKLVLLARFQPSHMRYRGAVEL
jgi:hypothetical protein